MRIVIDMLDAAVQLPAINCSGGDSSEPCYILRANGVIDRATLGYGRGREPKMRWEDGRRIIPLERVTHWQLVTKAVATP